MQVRNVKRLLIYFLIMLSTRQLFYSNNILQEELIEVSNEKKISSPAPWIIGGIVGGIMVIIGGIFGYRKKKENEDHHPDVFFTTHVYLESTDEKKMLCESVHNGKGCKIFTLSSKFFTQTDEEAKKIFTFCRSLYDHTKVFRNRQDPRSRESIFDKKLDWEINDKKKICDLKFCDKKDNDLKLSKTELKNFQDQIINLSGNIQIKNKFAKRSFFRRSKQLKKIKITLNELPKIPETLYNKLLAKIEIEEKEIYLLISCQEEWQQTQDTKTQSKKRKNVLKIPLENSLQENGQEVVNEGNNQDQLLGATS